MNANADLRIVRVSNRPDGVFGVALWQGLPFAVTLEHAYSDGQGWVPLIARGTYTCLRTVFHRGGYETFEVTGVIGHDRLLLHKGNFNRDSEGCILLGEQYSRSGDAYVAASGTAFAEFTELTRGINEFQLRLDNCWNAGSVL